MASVQISGIPIQEELTYCGAYPWSCSPLISQFILGYGIYLIGLLVVSTFLTLLIYLFGKLFKRYISFKKSVCVTFLIMLIVISFLVVRLLIIAGPTLFNKEVVNCLIRKAPSDCYEFAGMHYANSNNTFTQALKICNLTADTNQCKAKVCDNLVNTSNKQSCMDSVAKVCPNGYILDNIPCACGVLASPYAVYDKQWLDSYWNKYRKGDNFDYCCNGKQQENPCTNNF